MQKAPRQARGREERNRTFGSIRMNKMIREQG
ncbi:unnamed protein product, partial [marine sediment metagenome]